MGFDSFTIPGFANVTGFTAADMFGQATTTIDTFVGATIFFFASLAPYIAAAIMIAVILGFTVVIIRFFFIV